MDGMRKDGVNDRVNQEMIVCYTRENGKTISAKITGELVRCKDCKHCEFYGLYFLTCERHRMSVDADYYCADGIRENGDHHD